MNSNIGTIMLLDQIISFDLMVSNGAEDYFKERILFVKKIALIPGIKVLKP